MEEAMCSSWARSRTDVLRDSSHGARTAVLFIVSVVALALTVVSPAQAIMCWLTDESGFGFHDPDYRRNEVIYLSGEWDHFEFPCCIGDVYLVPNTGAPWDATRSIGPFIIRRPIQGCGGAGGFYGAILMLPEPELPLGEFDIVMDEDQDGVYHHGVDFVLGLGSDYALTVIDDLLDQQVDVAQIKENAGRQARQLNLTADWTHGLFAAVSLGHIVMTGLQLAVVTGNPLVGVGYVAIGLAGQIVSIPLSYDGVITSSGSKAITRAARQSASVYESIHADPPDPAFQELVEMAPIAYQPESSSEAHLNAIALLANRVEEVQTTAHALRRSYEKFLGAESAPDYGFARIQARASLRFCELMVDRSRSTVSALDSLRVAIEERGWLDRSWSLQEGRALRERVIASGLTTQEVNLMHANGMDDAEIDSIRVSIVASPLDSLADGSMRVWLIGVQQEAEAAIAYYESVSVDLATVTGLLANSWVNHPLAVITGDSVIAEGESAHVAGTASSDPNALPLSYAWDFDADGAFDDSSGPAAEMPCAGGGEYRLGLKVTNGSMLSDVDYRFIRVLNVNRAPRFLSVMPDTAYLVLEAGSGQEFAVTGDDPDGDPVTAFWSLDANSVGSGERWVFRPAAEDTGRHHVRARLDDGSLLSPDDIFVWRVDVNSASAGIGAPPWAPAWSLEPSRPNPFHPGATIRFSIPVAGQVELAIFDAIGRRVALLVDSFVPAGTHEARWDGWLDRGDLAPNGVYFIRLVEGSRSASRKIVVVH
jgi:hypothetical protein